ncbi:hypothetical protein B0H34DRAFT_712422 [Crassisporium funariophilum]|nr:hypothetical protein B0H34DRAFT_712422 [Crassisporium funariophilum]
METATSAPPSHVEGLPFNPHASTIASMSNSHPRPNHGEATQRRHHNDDTGHRRPRYPNPPRVGGLSAVPPVIGNQVGNGVASGRTNDRGAPRRRPREDKDTSRNRSPAPNSSNGDGASTSQSRPPRRRKPAAPLMDASIPPTSAEAGNNGAVQPHLNPRNRSRRNPTSITNTDDALPAPRKDGGRRANFGSGLTNPDSTGPSTTAHKPNQSRHKAKKPSAGPIGDDLTSTLIHGLSTYPYPDCPICFSSIRPEQAIWSCSPSIPTIPSSDSSAQYCWTAFHVKCIRSWAEKSVKDVAEAWRARGESDKKGDWRCPGCQAKRETVPSGYWCFCNASAEPKPLRLSTPHSCGNSCSRPRESGCGHPCPLSCHPGPCPPCQITTRLECYCPKKAILAFRCGIDAKGKDKGGRDLSCGAICGRTLSCGKHPCNKICHEGDCGQCQVKDMARCWCGKEEKEIGCGEGREVQCFIEGQSPWIGRFTCDSTCERVFDCGIHKCEKSCHPPSSTPATCPWSPSKISHCPCGRSTIAPSSSASQSHYTFPARLNCSSPIPTCDSTCSRPHPACSHPCKAKCHTGPCPPCSVQIVRPCRCGSSTKSLACYEVHSAWAEDGEVEEKEILCDRQCAALRACGRHQCRRLCCPLASLAVNVGKKGRRRVAAVDDGPGIGEEQGGLHECDLVCGKMLSCGNHRCEQRDHKGVCPPCLRSSFEELVCTCGRTVYEPPIPCGTRIQCHYPCPRPPLACGHPTTPHACHDDTVPCPPCAHLASKLCACGKKTIPNVRCSLETEKVSCGTVCGKLMTCGFHHCERLCHGDECGSCSAPCGKSRKSCLPNHHPCTKPCHAPSSCSETEPCQSLVTLTCPCGRIKQSVHCGRSVSHRSGHQHSTPKCSNDCQIAKRNARLADALGITENKAAAQTTYNDELVVFARANAKFLGDVEKAFADFVASEKRTQVLPHMPMERRKFVHDLANIYRIDTQMVDQEPHRSVQLLRRIDTRVPAPVLSIFIGSSAPPPNLGKLADLRAIRGSQSPSWRPTGTTSAHPPSKPSTPVNAPQVGSGPVQAQRGWTSVVARAGPSSSLAAPKPTASLAGLTVGSTGVGASSSTSHGGSASVSRLASPANVPPVSNVAVPESWEDDV